MFGRVIANRYRLTNRLGVGGMGSVWRAEHLTLGSQVAIKLIDELIASNAEIRERFEREAKAAASLRSPHVVQVLDYGVDEGTPYIAMELLEGESLDDRLTREVKLSPRDTLRIITDVARAVGKAHEAGITHRDLKPANIFLVKNDDAEMAKVLDFGVAKQSATAGRATQTGAMIGTPAYMSPEQAQGTKSVDPRTDLWALGAITFECLCGRLVFTSEAMGELILHICTKPLPIPSQEADLPEAFDAWFARALERDPDARFQSARELIDGLRAALADLPSGDNASGAPSARVHTPESRRMTPAQSERAGLDATFAHSGPAAGPTGASERSKTVGSFTSSGAIPTYRPSRLGLGLAIGALVVGAGAFLASRSPSDATPSAALKLDQAKEESAASSAIALTAAALPPTALTPTALPPTALPPSLPSAATDSASAVATSEASAAAGTPSAAPPPRWQPTTPPATFRPAGAPPAPMSPKPAPPPATPAGSDDRVGF
ncbi:MAG: protein kinase [Deltaproteobacteria bacterium]|nr:protein kinase [Deltaproteobacteria bacterium]